MDHTMRNIAILWGCCLILAWSGCNDHAANDAQNTSTLTTIRGQVSNWKLGDSMVVGARVGVYYVGSTLVDNIIGSSNVTIYGAFSFDLPMGPPQFLMKGSSLFPISDTTVQFALAEILLWCPSPSGSVLHLYNASDPRSIMYSDSGRVGQYLAQYIYADRDIRTENIPPIGSSQHPPIKCI